MFHMANDRGSVAGRKANFISYDDGYGPAKIVEQTRRLVEEDRVAAGDRSLCQLEEGPHLFLDTGADKWGNYQEHPWTIGFLPSNVTEARVYAKQVSP
jgi:branched-chain amino acid transport system substrate-binding protein